MNDEEIRHLQQSYYNLHEKYYKLKEELKFIYDINHHNLGERIRLRGIIIKVNELLDHLGFGGSDEYYMKKINEIKDILNECDDSD